MSEGEETINLALSGFALQWRSSSSSWRLIKASDLRSNDGSVNELGWEPLTGDSSPSGRGQRASRVDAGGQVESWWIAHGEAGDHQVVVELADGTRPQVQTVGGVWAAEWVSLPIRAVVTRDDRVIGHLMFDREAHYGHDRGKPHATG